VAGEYNSNTSSTPESFLAALIASRMAKKTDEPIKSGGSPTTSQSGNCELGVTSSRSLDCSKILPFDILKETYSEVLGNIPAVSLEE